MKKLENGRSMIEMLGVLAIIGVLSVAGLSGYTMAMNRHKANNALDYAARVAVLAQTKGDGTDPVDAGTNCSTFDNTTVTGISNCVVEKASGSSTVTLTVTTSDEPIADAMRARSTTNFVVAGSGTTATITVG